MKQVCLVCERTSSDHNLYCQDVHCPAERSPLILDYGEWLGDIEIVRPVSVLRTAAIYEARRQQQRVLLKVAHPGEQHVERLKREASLLAVLQQRRQQQPHLPVLYPAYSGAALSHETLYGRAMLQGRLMYYIVLASFEGESLRDVLKKQPELWINHVGWIVIALGTAMRALHARGMLHLGLCPESLLVRLDEQSHAPRVLLADLGLASPVAEASQHWYPTLVPAAYTAPELVPPLSGQPDVAADVYGMGLMLYELLVGRPPYPAMLRSDREVYELVRRGRVVPMTRTEDLARAATIATRAVSQAPETRPPDAAALSGELAQLVGGIPHERRSLWPSLEVALVVVVVLLAIAFVITLAINIDELARQYWVAAPGLWWRS